MNKYTIRIDVIEGISQDATLEIIQSAVERFDKYIIALEIADITKKLHYQGIIYTDIPMKTYRTYMERKFALWAKHKGSRSFASVKKDSYEVYITKDGDIQLSKGYTDDEIKTLSQQSYKKKEKDKKKKLNWFDTLYEECCKAGMTQCSDGWQIAAEIIKCYNTFIKCEPNDFQLKCYAKSIQRRLVYDYSIKNNRLDVFDRYVRLRAQAVIGHEWVHLTV